MEGVREAKSAATTSTTNGAYDVTRSRGKNRTNKDLSTLARACSLSPLSLSLKLQCVRANLCVSVCSFISFFIYLSSFFQS